MDTKTRNSVQEYRRLLVASWAVFSVWLTLVGWWGRVTHILGPGTGPPHYPWGSRDITQISNYELLMRFKAGSVLNQRGLEFFQRPLNVGADLLSQLLNGAKLLLIA